MLVLTTLEFIERKKQLEKQLKFLVKGKIERIIYGIPGVHNKRNSEYWEVKFKRSTPRLCFFDLVYRSGVYEEFLCNEITQSGIATSAMLEVSKNPFSDTPRDWHNLSTESKTKLLTKMYKSEWYGV